MTDVYPLTTASQPRGRFRLSVQAISRRGIEPRRVLVVIDITDAADQDGDCDRADEQA